MLYIPLSEALEKLASIAVIKGETVDNNADEELELYQQQQDNLNSFLGSMPILSDIIEEWQVSDYYNVYGEPDTDLLSFHQMLVIAENKLGIKVSLDAYIQCYQFMTKLHQTLSGKLPEQPSKVSRMHDVYDSSYVPFLVSFIRFGIVYNKEDLDQVDCLMEQSF